MPTELDALERELQRQRRRLRGIENAAARDLKRTYLGVYRRLRDRLDALLQEIKAIEAAGETVNTSRLTHLWQYETLLAELEREVWAFGRQATEIVSAAQREALSTANVDAKRLTELALGGPRSARLAVLQDFITLSPGAIEQFVGFANKAPLSELFDAIPQTTKKAAQDAISYGIGRGQSPRVVAREFRKVASVPLDRALTISRTEMHRAYRSASLDVYRANSDVVAGWEWIAQLDDRTCPACAAMNGQIQSLYVDPTMHINCRCALVPKTKSWKELGFDGIEEPERLTAKEMFDALDASTQRSILGPGRYDLYKSGKIGLDDMVTVRKSAKWGDTVASTPLKDLVA